MTEILRVYKGYDKNDLVGFFPRQQAIDMAGSGTNYCACVNGRKCQYHAGLKAVQQDRGGSLRLRPAPTQAGVDAFRNRMADLAEERGYTLDTNAFGMRGGWVSITREGRPYMLDITRKVSIKEHAGGEIEFVRWLAT